MGHPIPSHKFFANYRDEGTMYHPVSQMSQLSSPLSDSSYRENPPYSDSCSPTWTHSVSNSPENLEIPISGQKVWDHETVQNYTLSSSASPLETSADGNLNWYSYYDNEPSRGMTSYSNSDQGPTQVGGSRISQNLSDWIPGVESHNRTGFNAPNFYTSSQSPGSFSQHPEIQVLSHPRTSLASLVPSHPSVQPSFNSHTESQQTVDRRETRDTPDSTEDSSLDAPYSHLIYEALMNAPQKKLPLQGIYSWFEKHTAKGKDQKSKGWQNSIRHNLSMNAGFEAVKGDTTNGKKAMNYWRLTDNAIKKGIQSTTRYRKQANHKRRLGSDPPAPQRQRSGAKGGKATKTTAKYRGQMLMITGQDDVQREQPHHHPAAPLQPLPMGSYYHPCSIQANISAAIVSPAHVSEPATLMPRPSTEHCGLNTTIGCTEGTPCTTLFCDMAAPCAEYYVAYENGLGRWCQMWDPTAAMDIHMWPLFAGCDEIMMMPTKTIMIVDTDMITLDTKNKKTLEWMINAALPVSNFKLPQSLYLDPLSSQQSIETMTSREVKVEESSDWQGLMQKLQKKGHRIYPKHMRNYAQK